MTSDRVRQQPIATPVARWDWPQSQTQPIEECGEPLVPMGLVPEKILVSPQYFLQKLDGALPDVLCREAVLTRLTAAGEELPRGFRFVVYDCWRPLGVQRLLFDEQKEEMRKRNPGATQAELTDMALIYVALPSTDPLKPSPHNTGGAIDLSIVDADNRPLDMGGAYDEASEISATMYFEKKLAMGEALSRAEIRACENRRLLYGIMTRAGFTNYIDEWWHFDYGNQNWAWASGAGPAIYGMASRQDLVDGVGQLGQGVGGLVAS